MVDERVGLESLAKAICDLTVIEASELAEILKDKLNIQDVPVVAHALVNSSEGGANESGHAVKEEVSILLKSFEDNKKARIIKALREIKKKEGLDIGVKEAKDLLESAPVKICENIPTSKADQYLQLLKDAGAEVEAE